MVALSVENEPIHECALARLRIDEFPKTLSFGDIIAPHDYIMIIIGDQNYKLSDNDIEINHEICLLAEAAHNQSVPVTAVSIYKLPYGDWCMEFLANNQGLGFDDEDSPIFGFGKIDYIPTLNENPDGTKFIHVYFYTTL
jgi:hypothetical protein